MKCVCIALLMAGHAFGALVDEVDPFIGVDGEGQTLPGAGLPFGFVRLSPDMDCKSASGYESGKPVIGFSHTHVSGTGGGGKYGNFRVTPVTGAIRLEELSSPITNETASPGYYAATLTRWDVRAELTATRLVGLHRYSFPTNAPAHVLIDVSSVVGNQRPLSASVRVVPPDRMEGTMRCEGGWNEAAFTLHFAAVFDRPFAASGVWADGALQPGVAKAKGTRVGAFADFKEREVQLKVGVSFVSPEQARANIDHEMRGWDFERVRRNASVAWESVLSKLTVEGGTAEQRRIFYTAMYHAHFMPHDVSGENVWWKSGEPHYEDYCAIWDTFRTANPLWNLLQPKRARDMVRSLLDIGEHAGWLPDARVAGNNGLTQGGSNGEVLIADAIVKDLGGFDYERAYKLLLHDADVDSLQPYSLGRELKDYLHLGYVPSEAGRGGSRTLEYAYNDYCVAKVAAALNHREDHRRLLARSRNWTNLWDKTTGFIRPRDAAGQWRAPFFPERNSSGWSGGYYEGNAWQYTPYVPHDIATLIRFRGGDAAFVKWLDELFDDGHYAMRNEPGFLTPYLYIHAGRHDRTAERVRALLAEHFHATRRGLRGNDDSGAMSAWFVWGAIGLFPNAGQPYYYIGSPIFPRSRMDLGGGHSFVIETSGTGRYVSSAKLNDQPLTRAWLHHREIIAGGVLHLEMTNAPTQWGGEPRPPCDFQ